MISKEVSLAQPVGMESVHVDPNHLGSSPLLTRVWVPS
jgi:hypothetical protein